MRKFMRMMSLVISVVLFAGIMAGCANGIGGKTGLIISEAVSSNGSSYLVEGLGSPDWIELYNASNVAIDLEGYTISRADAIDKEYTFPSVVIEPGEYKVICACENTAEDTDAVCVGFKLPKEGCSLTVKNASNVTMDTMAVPALERDVSYCYTDRGYRYCAVPTPGSANAGAMSTSLETLEQVSAPEGLRINEATRDWAEIYNGSKEKIGLSAYFLSDDEANPSKWRFPDVTLKPGEYLLVNLDGLGEINTDFGISSYENHLYMTYRDEVVSEADFTGLWEGMSVGFDAEGKQVYYTVTTPGEENTSKPIYDLELGDMPDSEPLIITEVMLKNETCLVDEYGDRPEWLEIYNRSDAAVSTKNYYLSDDTEDLLKWALPEMEIGAGEYIVIYMSGRGEGNHASFRIGKGESIIFTDLSILASQKIELAEEERLNNISYGLQDGKWLFFGKGTPGRANTAYGTEKMENVEKLDRGGVFISEVSAVIGVRSGEKDWIELYNAGDKAVSLDNWYMSDDIDEPKKAQLKGEIPAGGYFVVYASGNPSKQTSGTLTFGINQAGEQLVLSDSDGNTVDVFETGSLRKGTTSGRETGVYSGERVFFSTPTKGAANATPLKGQVQSPVFSEPGGYASCSVTVAIEGDGDIYYTTDGSTPTAEDTKYTQPITLTKTTVLTAVCIKEGHLPSDRVSSTYLFEEKHKIPVVSISTAPEDFRAVHAVTEWSVNKSTNVERYCHIEYFEPDGTLGTSFHAGFRVSGNSTRTAAQKSFSIALRGTYGQTSVVYPFFEDYPISEFTSLTLRNAGQNRVYSRIADAYASMLFRDMEVDNAETRFVAVYINGQYWGAYDLKENQNENGLARRLGADPDEANVIRRNTVAISGTNTEIKKVYGYAQRWNLADEDKYNEFCKYVDEDAWIDYIIARSFTGDGDMFNQKLWATQSYSVRWRPIFYDCDFAFGGTNASTLGRYFTGEGVPSKDTSLTNMWIPTALKKSPIWREKFLTRLSEVLPVIEERSLTLYDEMAAELETEMPRHIKRWGAPSSMSVWKGYVKNMRNVVDKRPEVLLRQVQSVFGVSNERMKELFPDHY